MSRPFSPKVITANDLLDGDVIYLTATDRWSRVHSEAELLTDEAHAQLRLLDAQADGHVVGPYLADALPGKHGPEPVHFREALRTTGPSSYTSSKAGKSHVSV